MENLKFRARVKMDGKKTLFYQQNQFLTSFLRRVTSFLAWEKDALEGRHESYLPEYALEKSLDMFTGHKDKNGQEIYAGDLITDIHGEVREVQFIDGGFWCVYSNGDKVFPAPHIREVVGNTWDDTKGVPSLAVLGSDAPAK